MMVRSVMIDVRKIKQHPMNPRKDLGDLTELIDSIRKQGILQNLTVVSDPDATEEFERFIAVIGHRRLAAAKSAGLTEVPCNIVEMTMQEQLVTMMSENMQRADLTPYEQAHGFQTMLDFGEDIDSITVKTGLSESTVRRRLKLLELDQPKLKAAVDKGVSLVDLMRLEKIEDQEERNKVLADIGTNNFEYSYKNAISKQNDEKDLQKLIDQISSWARPAVSEEELNKAKFYKSIYVYEKKKEIEIPADINEREYIFIKQSTSVFIKKIIHPSDDDNELEKQKAEEMFREKQKAEEMFREKQKQRLHSLELEWQKCRDLRREFVLERAEKQAKNLSRVIMKQMLINSFSYYSRPDADLLAEVTGTDIEVMNNEINTGNSIEKLSLIHTYLVLDHNISPYDWRGNYCQHNRLSSIKEYMLSLGYEISDVELSLFDGTHELFCKTGEGK